MIMDLLLNTVWPAVKILLTILVVVVPVILGVAYMTLAERKVIAAAQFRHGPNVVGPFGVLQPWADAFKLMFKEVILPAGANKVVFFIAPMLMFIVAAVVLYCL